MSNVRANNIEQIPAPEPPTLDDWQETRLAIIRLAISQLPADAQKIFTAIFINAMPKSEFCRLSGLSRWQLNRKIEATTKALEKNALIRSIARI